MGHLTVNPELQVSSNPLVQIWYYIKYLGLRIWAQLKRGLFYDVHQKVELVSRLGATLCIAYPRTRNSPQAHPVGWCARIHGAYKAATPTPPA